jgi:signal transduction histidine kinase
VSKNNITFLPKTLIILKQSGVAGLYVLLGLADYHYFSSTFWPGSGLALSAVLIGGWRYLWSIFFGSLLLGKILFPNASVLMVCGMTLAHVSETFLGAWLMTYYRPFTLKTLQDYFRLVLLGGAVACFVGINISVSTLLLAHSLAPIGYFKVALLWWMGDTLGVILVAPLILSFAIKSKEGLNHKWLETLLAMGITFFIGQIVFMGWCNEFFNGTPKGLFMFLPITWIAIRLDMRVTTFALNMIAVQALFGAYFKVGYFANAIVNSHLYYYWIYVVTLSVVVMTLTITVNALKEKERYQQKIEKTLKTLLDEERHCRIEQNNFMIMLAHELKTPLSTMSIVLDTPIMSENMLFHARRAISDMNHVLESCVQSERLSLEKEKIKTVNCTPIDILNHLCNNSNVPKRFIVTSTTSTVINTDEQLFRTVLSNLIDNALKYSLPDSFIQVNDKKGISITIQNLIGVASYPDAEKVFQKYYRHKAAHHKTGSGLGLYLVKELAQLLNGDVFYNHDTTSVTFKLWLPISHHPV